MCTCSQRWSERWSDSWCCDRRCCGSVIHSFDHWIHLLAAVVSWRQGGGCGGSKTVRDDKNARIREKGGLESDNDREGKWWRGGKKRGLKRRGGDRTGEER